MIKLYNTLTRKKENFQPLEKNKVGLYTCGPTVYDCAHIGNLRTYIFEDILKRTLIANNYRVKHVMNITNVGHLTSDADEGEDKMEKGARREGKTAWEIAECYTQAFMNDLNDLNILEPTIWCKATDHIKEQIDWIKKLEKKGYTYQIADGVYFNTAKFPAYGSLTRQKLADLKEGARVEKNLEKKNPTDFALWKLSPLGNQRDMEWPSPWGIGFPGWHIECSVMSIKYLGEHFDIHCGGIDHIPIHHTNEIAQAEAVTGKQFVNYWLHGDFLILENDKMAKSGENFITLKTLQDKGIDPLAYRLFCLGAHYRSKLNFKWEALQASQNALDNLNAIAASLGEPKIGCAEFEQKFMDAMNDDLNAPRALAVVWDLLKSDYPASAKKTSLLKFDEILGLNLKNIKNKKTATILTQIAQYEFVFDASSPNEKKDKEKKIRQLDERRAEAKNNRDYIESDKIRQEIEDTGTMVKDK